MTPKEKVYFAFYQTKKEQLYFNELKELTSLSNSSLQNVLLKSGKEFTKIKEKSNVFFKLKRFNDARLMFEKFDIERFYNLDRGVRIPLKDLLKYSPKEIHSIILFGSASRKKESENSDIDIMIVLYHFENKDLQKKYEAEIKKRFEFAKRKAEIISNYPISIFFINSQQYNLSKDFLILQGKETGFPIFGNNHYYEDKFKEIFSR